MEQINKPIYQQVQDVYNQVCEQIKKQTCHQIIKINGNYLRPNDINWIINQFSADVNVDNGNLIISFMPQLLEIAAFLTTTIYSDDKFLQNMYMQGFTIEDIENDLAKELESQDKTIGEIFDTYISSHTAEALAEDKGDQQYDNLNNN